MKIRNILLTGDDGYNSVGTRVLIHYLKRKYNLSIAATKLQQSGVGGKLSISHPVHWEKIQVDGINGFCVDGTPGDAVELAREYFKTHFDLVISGINLGVNVGGTFPASGTVSAAERALLLQVAKKSIALSLHVEDTNHYFRSHDGIENIRPYLEYPGKTAIKLLNTIIENNLWNCQLVNVNFPLKKTNKVLFTRPTTDITTFYKYPLHKNYKASTFTYPFDLRKTKSPITTDAGAVQRGYISVTLCKADSVNEEVYKKLKDKTLTI